MRGGKAFRIKNQSREYPFGTIQQLHFNKYIEQNKLQQQIE